MSDTPTQRATINQMHVNDLDAMLTAMRERRLERVQKLEALAKIKSDEVQLTSWLAFERAYGIAMRYMKKLEEAEAKAEQLIHKVRLKAMVVRFEVDNMEQDDAAD